MTTKAELLNRAAREYNAFEAAIHGLNEDQLTEVWFDTWSICDIVAHMSGWHREMGPALERLARREKPLPAGVTYDDVDDWNAKFALARKRWQVADVLLELDRTHEYFMHAAAEVPDDRVEPGRTAYRIIDSVSAEHYKEHSDQILGWRRERGV